MLQECNYNPVVDLCAVSQRGFIDLAQCIGQGYVPTAVDDSEESYNGLDVPDAVGAMPVDVFEAIRASNVIGKATVVAQSSDVDPNV